MNTVVFPQFPQLPVVVGLLKDVQPETLAKVKTELVAANPDYDFCFLNPTHIVSLEHLYSAIHRAVSNQKNDTMRAKTLNTEIIFNLLPVNNIVDALRRFGVDETCSSLIAIKVLDDSSNIEEHLQGLLGVKPVPLTDEALWELVDRKKFKKLYKLNDAKTDDSQASLTRLAICACQLRGL